MKKPFYFFFSSDINQIKIYRIDGDVPRLIGTTNRSELKNDFSDVINFLKDNKLGDETSRIINL